MEQETEKILENIRLKRTERKVSVLNLAIQAGISNSHLYYIETKRVIPSIDVCVKISKALGIDIMELVEQPTLTRRDSATPCRNVDESL